MLMLDLPVLASTVFATPRAVPHLALQYAGWQALGWKVAGGSFVWQRTSPANQYKLPEWYWLRGLSLQQYWTETACDHLGALLFQRVYV